MQIQERDRDTRLFDDRILRLFLEVMEDFRRLKIRFGHVSSLKLTRARKSAGVCKRIRTASAFEYVIGFSKYYLGLEDREAKNILAHELIHTVRGCYNHGINFKQRAEKLNRAGYDVRTHISDRQHEQAKERLKQCQTIIVCGLGCEFYANPKSKMAREPEKYRCRKHKLPLFRKEPEEG